MKKAFYEPFRTVEDVKPYFGKYIVVELEIGDKIPAKVIKAFMSPNKVLQVQLRYSDGKEIYFKPLDLFYNATYDNHRFGKEMEGFK